MGKYILKRLGYIVVVFLIVSLLMYSLYNLIPRIRPVRNWNRSAGHETGRVRSGLSAPAEADGPG